MTIRSATLQFCKRIALVAAPSKASTLITTIIIALSRVAQIAPTQIEIKAIVSNSQNRHLTHPTTRSAVNGMLAMIAAHAQKYRASAFSEVFGVSGRPGAAAPLEHLRAGVRRRRGF